MKVHGDPIGYDLEIDQTAQEARADEQIRPANTRNNIRLRADDCMAATSLEWSEQ